MRVLVFTVLLAGAYGCARDARPGPDVYDYAVATAEADPATIERAPRVYYRGGWAHLVEGRWYYATDRGWVVFVEEPAELRRHRDSIASEETPGAPMPRGPAIHRDPGASTPIPVAPAKVK